MKHLFSLLCLSISLFGFSQEKMTQQNTPPLFISTGNTENFDTIYNRLSAISDNINKTTTTIKSLDEIRQGQLILSTKNIGKSLTNFKIDVRPSLDIELQRIMYSGNFLNPRQRRPIVIKQ